MLKNAVCKVRIGATSNYLSNLELTSLNSTRSIHRSCVDRKFYESNPRGEYKDRELHKELNSRIVPSANEFKQSFQDIRGEVKKWAFEWKEKLMNDTKDIVMDGDKDKIWTFSSKDDLKGWNTLCDSEHNEGFSRCELIISPTGKALFHGFVNTTPPKDGRIKKAGYCVMKSIRPRKSFYRESYHEWDPYTHLLMRVRGDGRHYMLTISTAGFYDITWNDAYHYILYTRGGPYWQYAKIPFSKFVFGSKGRVQDLQEAIPLDRVANLQIAAARVDGPFCLEIDYIGLERDPEHEEEFAYEEYRIPPFIANV